VPGGEYASGADPQTTNQRMEIQAALEAARSLEGPLDIVSDSTYVVNCFRDRWWEGWLERGWLNKAKKPVANRDLWEPLIDLYRAAPRRLKFRWVKGHADDANNDLVDRLAVEAARSQQGRTGTGTPENLGAADARAGPGEATRDPRLPEGHLIAVVGHRPPEIGGYDANEVAEGVRRTLGEVVLAKWHLHPDLHVLTGLGLGAEQLAAEAALASSVPFVAVLPYPDQESVRPAASRARYRELLDNAERTVILQAKPPESKQQAGAALARRDAFLARHADEAVAVWDGQDPRVGRLVRSLQDHLGEENVWLLAPRP
jgi:ribonuclease HI